MIKAKNRDLMMPEKGEVLYDGRNFLAMGKKEKKHLRREMGMIFQSAALFDSMSVLDNVMFPLNMFGTDTLREQTKRAMFCLDRVNLTEAKDKFPGEISTVFPEPLCPIIRLVFPFSKVASILCNTVLPSNDL